MNRSEIEERLRHIDLSVLRSSLIKMMQTWPGYWEPNTHKAIMGFINNPCMETAVALVQQCPDILPTIIEVEEMFL